MPVIRTGLSLSFGFSDTYIQSAVVAFLPSVSFYLSICREDFIPCDERGGVRVEDRGFVTLVSLMVLPFGVASTEYDITIGQTSLLSTIQIDAFVGRKWLLHRHVSVAISNPDLLDE